MPLQHLDGDDRLRLVRFLCAFMWADLHVDSKERQLLQRVARSLGLSEAEQEQADVWITHPPAAEDIDPSDIPEEHRALFVRTVKQMIEADGVVDDFEAENLALFEELLG